MFCSTSQLHLRSDASVLPMDDASVMLLSRKHSLTYLLYKPLLFARRGGKTSYGALRVTPADDNRRVLALLAELLFEQSLKAMFCSPSHFVGLDLIFAEAHARGFAPL